MREIELISLPELEEIRRIWVVEKHEFEDSLPQIYERATSENYPGPKVFEDQRLFGAEEMEVLREVCSGDSLQYELLRDLIDTEHSYRTMLSRRGIFDALESAVRRHFYEDAEDALRLARDRKTDIERAEEGLFSLPVLNGNHVNRSVEAQT